MWHRNSAKFRPKRKAGFFDDLDHGIFDQQVLSGVLSHLLPGLSVMLCPALWTLQGVAVSSALFRLVFDFAMYGILAPRFPYTNRL